MSPDSLYSLLAEAPAASSSAPKTDNAKPATPPQGENTPKTGSQWKLTVDRSVFFNGVSTGEELHKESYKPTGEYKPEQVTLTEADRIPYRNFLKKYITTLANVRRRNENGLSGQYHTHDRKILESFVNDKGEIDSNNIESQINEFLNEPENWMLATVAMEHLSAGLRQALRIKAIMYPPPEQSTQIDNHTVRLGIDQGWLAKFWEDSARPWLDRSIHYQGGRQQEPPRMPRLPGFLSRYQGLFPDKFTVRRGDVTAVSAASSAAFGTAGMAFGPLGPIVGAAIPSVLVASRGLVHNLTKNGLEVDIHGSAAAFKALKDDPQELAFMSEFTGINLSNYEVVGDHVVKRPDANDDSRGQAPQEIEKDAIRAMFARNNFLTRIGIPESELQANPEQFLTLPPRDLENLMANEKTGFKPHQDIFTEFDKEGGLRDKWGQDRKNPFFGRADASKIASGFIPDFKPTNLNTTDPTIDTWGQRRDNPFFGRMQAPHPGPWPDFNPEYLDIANNLMRWQHARANVLGKWLERDLQELETEKEKSGRISQLDEQIKGLDEAQKAKVGEYEAKKKQFDGEEENITKELEKIEGYKTKIAQFQESQTKTQAEIRSSRTTLLSRLQNPGVGGAGGTPFGNEKLAEAALRRVLDTPGASIIIDGRAVTSTMNRFTEAEKAKNAQYPAQGTGEKDTPYQVRLRGERESREAEYIRTIARIEADVKLINDTITELNKKIDTTAEAPNEHSPEVVLTQRNLNVLPQELKNLFDIETTLGAAGVGLTPANIRTESIDKIMERINKAHEANNALGWAKDQNDNPSNRMRVIHAMTEARARAINSFVALPGAEHQLLANRPDSSSPGWNITEHQLLTLTSKQINEIIKDRSANNTLYMNTPVVMEFAIEKARTVAMERLKAREEAMRKIDEEWKVQSEVKKLQGEAVSIFETKTKKAMSRELASNQGEINKRAKLIAVKAQQILDPTPVDPNAANYSEAEKKTYKYTLPPPVGGGPAPAPIDRQYSVGYLRLMDKLFDYRSKPEKGSSDKTFQRAVELIPPDQLATLLDETLVYPNVPGLGVRNDIDLVLTDVRDLLQRGRIDALKLRESFEKVIDTVVNRALALKPIE